MKTEDTREDAIWRAKLHRFRRDRNRYLVRAYGITLDAYEGMLIRQKNSCAVCGNSDAGNTRSLYNVFSVDRDRKTGKVRGLLCMPCNLTLVPAVEYYAHRIQAAKKYLSGVI